METQIKFMNIFSPIKFKSYYVVWKPQKKQFIMQKVTGLNRTM